MRPRLNLIANYLPYDILDFPEDFTEYQSVGTMARQNKLVADVIALQKAGKPLPEKHRMSLVFHPDLVLSLYTSNHIGLDELNVLLRRKGFAVRFLAYGINRVKHLVEPAVEEDLESLEIYIKHMASRLQDTIKPIEELVKTVEADPNRILRVMPEEHLEKTMAIIRKVSLRRRGTAPEWAFAWFATHNVEILPDDVRDAISCSEEYIYMTAKVFEARGRAMDDSLLPHINSPRWSYHFLRENMAGDCYEKMMNSMLTHPAWTVQYASDLFLETDEVNELYLECSRKSQGTKYACLMTDMHEWYKARPFPVYNVGMAPEHHRNWMLPLMGIRNHRDRFRFYDF